MHNLQQCWKGISYVPTIRDVYGAGIKQSAIVDAITSLCGYSSVSDAWKVFAYVKGGASAIWDE